MKRDKVKFGKGGNSYGRGKGEGGRRKEFRERGESCGRGWGEIIRDRRVANHGSRHTPRGKGT